MTRGPDRRAPTPNPPTTAIHDDDPHLVALEQEVVTRLKPLLGTGRARCRVHHAGPPPPGTPIRPRREVVREAAITQGVCIRPVVTRVVDTLTGAVELVPIACGSTREAQCPPCAGKARRLRMHQCRESWHLDTEPPEPTPAPDGTIDDQDEDGQEL